METCNFVPSVVKSGEFEGSVSVEFLDFDTRWQHNAELADLQSKLKDGTASEQVALIRFLARAAFPCVKVVQLKSKCGKRVYSSPEALLRDPRCTDVVQEICLFVLTGTDSAEPEAKKD